MKNPIQSKRGALCLLGFALCSHIITASAFTFTLQEQGGLTGFVNGGGGSVIVNFIATDHWTVMVQDARIGNQNTPALNLAFIEPELVSGMTGYNNIQLLSLTPGVATFDVLSDEFSPYAVQVQNGAISPVVGTDIDSISMRFVDFADSVPEPGAAALFLSGAGFLVWRKKRLGDA